MSQNPNLPKSPWPFPITKSEIPDKVQKVESNVTTLINNEGSIRILQNERNDIENRIADILGVYLQGSHGSNESAVYRQIELLEKKINAIINKIIQIEFDIFVKKALPIIKQHFMQNKKEMENESMGEEGLRGALLRTLLECPIFQEVCRRYPMRREGDKMQRCYSILIKIFNISDFSVYKLLIELGAQKGEITQWKMNVQKRISKNVGSSAYVGVSFNEVPREKSAPRYF